MFKLLISNVFSEKKWHVMLLKKYLDTLMQVKTKYQYISI